MQVHDDVYVEGTMTRIGLAMRVIAEEEENIKKLLDNIDAAHNVGWFIDPTAYMNALYRGDMDEMAELLNSLKKPIEIWNEKIVSKLAKQ